MIFAFFRWCKYSCCVQLQPDETSLPKREASKCCINYLINEFFCELSVLLGVFHFCGGSFGLIILSKVSTFSFRMARTLTIGNGQTLECCPYSKVVLSVEHSTVKAVLILCILLKIVLFIVLKYMCCHLAIDPDLDLIRSIFCSNNCRHEFEVHERHGWNVGYVRQTEITALLAPLEM